MPELNPTEDLTFEPVEYYEHELWADRVAEPSLTFDQALKALEAR